MKPAILNIADLKFDATQVPVPPRLEEKYGCSRASVGQALGAQKLGYSIVRVPPGKRAYPFHNHCINEEMFFILEGAGEVRIGRERHPVKQGDFIAHPPGGPDTAHQLVNTSKTAELRYLGVSTQSLPEICDYPDSGKFGVMAQYPAGPDGKPKGLRFLGREKDSLDYWDDETPIG